jgi:hypothetical protein
MTSAGPEYPYSVEIARAAGYKSGISKLQLLKSPHLCAALLQTKGLKPDDVLRALMGWPGISVHSPLSHFFLGFYGHKPTFNAILF